MAEAVATAHNMFTASKGDRPEAINVMVPVTLGASMDDPVPLAESARAAGIVVLPVGVLGSVNTAQIQEMGTPPAGDTTFLATSLSDLTAQVRGIKRQVCRSVGGYSKQYR